MIAPDGIENTSHQIFGGGGTFAHGFHVSGFVVSIRHCPVPGVPDVMYTGVFEPATVALGSKTSTTWNGLMWMWNGCEMRLPFPLSFGYVSLTTFHSSVWFSTMAAPTSPSKSLPSIVCSAGTAVAPASDDDAKTIVRVACTLSAGMSTRNGGNEFRWSRKFIFLSGPSTTTTLSSVSCVGFRLAARSLGSTVVLTNNRDVPAAVGALTSRSARLPEARRKGRLRLLAAV